MPLLQDRVEIILTSNIIKYYEDLGYEIPRRKDSRGRMKVPEGTKLIVRIEDLPKGSGISIYMSCDNCGKEFYRVWRDHKFYNNQVYCASCSGILHSGELAYNWNPKLSDEDRVKGRDYPEYHDFIKRVLNRDNYTCKVCNDKSGGLAVHHLNGYNWCIEGRTKDTNGITLCKKCHNAFHSVYGHGSNTKEQFEDWIGSPIGELATGKLPTARRVICMDDGNIIDSAPLAAKRYGLDRNSLYSVLNRNMRSIHGSHFLWFDDYYNMTKEEVSLYWRWVINKKSKLG